MSRRAFTVRAAGLIATGAVAVHELRYLLGGEPNGVGHGYLPFVGLLSAVLLGVAGAQLAGVLERARRTGTSERRGLGFSRAWLLATVTLALIFVTQELVEGLLAAGRSPGIEAVIADGGLTALPLAVAAGALVALALAGAGAAVGSAAALARRTVRRRAPGARRSRSPSPRAPRAGVLARHRAGRAPPPASLTV